MPYKGKKTIYDLNEREEQRRRANWQHSETIMLLDEIRLNRRLLLSSSVDDITNKKKEEVWENIGHKITAAFGISQRTGLKCREKWTTLKMAFKGKKRYSMGTGGGLPKPFFDAVAAILGEKTGIVGGLPASGSGASLQHSPILPGSLNQNQHQLFTYDDDLPSEHTFDIVHLEIPETTFGILPPNIADSGIMSSHLQREAQLTVDNDTVAAKKRKTLHLSYENSSPHNNTQERSNGCGVSIISDIEATEGEAQLTADSDKMLTSGLTVPEGLNNSSTPVTMLSGSAGTKRKEKTALWNSYGQEGKEADPLFQKYLQTTVDKNISDICMNRLHMAHIKLKHKKVLLQIKLLEMQVMEKVSKQK